MTVFVEHYKIKNNKDYLINKHDTVIRQIFQPMTYPISYLII